MGGYSSEGWFPARPRAQCSSNLVLFLSRRGTEMGASVGMKAEQGRKKSNYTSLRCQEAKVWFPR